jgi:hypothetical protein
MRYTTNRDSSALYTDSRQNNVRKSVYKSEGPQQREREKIYSLNARLSSNFLVNSVKEPGSDALHSV